MNASDTATLRLVDNELESRQQQRAAAINDRISALGGVSERELHRRSGLARDTIAKALDPAPGTRVYESTFRRLEEALDDLEEEMGMADPEPVAQAAPVARAVDTVTFRVAGNFGVEVTVEGPVADMDKMQAYVERLIDRMGQQQGQQGNDTP